MVSVADQERQRLRVLRFLSLGPVTVRNAATSGRFLFDGDGRGTFRRMPRSLLP